MQNLGILNELKTITYLSYMKMRRTNEDLIKDIEKLFYEEVRLPKNSLDPVLNVMKQIDRYSYVKDCEFPCGPERAYSDNYVNIALGSENLFEKIVSPQPSFVAYWTHKLNLKDDQKVLEVGTGIGYQGAVFAKSIHPNGKLFTIEVRGDLSERAQENFSKYNPELQNVEFIVDDGTLGYPSEAPFDRIYLTACIGPNFKEDVILQQLKQKGVLLYPTPHDTQTSIMNLVIREGNDFKREQRYGPRFVPLIGKNSGF